MLNDFNGADRVFIACGYTDLRKGIDGLSAMVQQEFELDPFTNTLFLSADDVGIESRACTGSRMASSSCTNAWSAAYTNGRGMSANFGS